MQKELDNEARRVLISLVNQCMQAFVTFQFDTCEILLETLELNVEHRNLSVVIIKNLNSIHPEYSNLTIRLLDRAHLVFYEVMASSSAIIIP